MHPANTTEFAGRVVLDWQCVVGASIRQYEHKLFLAPRASQQAGRVMPKRDASLLAMATQRDHHSDER